MATTRERVGRDIWETPGQNIEVKVWVKDNQLEMEGETRNAKSQVVFVQNRDAL